MNLYIHVHYKRLPHVNPQMYVQLYMYLSFISCTHTSVHTPSYAIYACMYVRIFGFKNGWNRCKKSKDIFGLKNGRTFRTKIGGLVGIFVRFQDSDWIGRLVRISSDSKIRIESDQNSDDSSDSVASSENSHRFGSESINFRTKIRTNFSAG